VRGGGGRDVSSPGGGRVLTGWRSLHSGGVWGASHNRKTAGQGEALPRSIERSEPFLVCVCRWRKSGRGPTAIQNLAENRAARLRASVLEYGQSSAAFSIIAVTRKVIALGNR